MAQGRQQQIESQVLNDLRQRFPEIPVEVVSQCMLQNNNFEACCLALKQESNKFLYDYPSPDDTRMSRNHLLHINVGFQPHATYQLGDAVQLNGSRTLVHSSSDGHIDPQHGGSKQPVHLGQEPHSAPAIVAASPTYNPFIMGDQGRNTPTPPPQQAASLPPGMNTSPMQGISSTYMHVSRYSMNPVAVTVAQNMPSGQTVPRALHIHPQMSNSPYGSVNSMYIRQTSPGSSGRQTPQNAPWHSSTQQYNLHALSSYQTQQNYQPSQYSPKQPQIPQSAFHSPPPSQCPSPQHQVQTNQAGYQTSHVFMPISPPFPYQQAPQSYQQQGGHPMPYIPYGGTGMSKGSMKKIEITLETPQRPGATMSRSSSPISSQPPQRGQPTWYITTNSASSSPSRGMSGQPQPSYGQPQPSYGLHPLYIQCPQLSGPVGAQVSSPRGMVTQPNSKLSFKITVARSPTESLLNLVDPADHPGAPEPIQPISATVGSVGDKGSQKSFNKSSSGSDDYAYTQALLLHQRARKERLAKELCLEKQRLEKFKTVVNEMEYDLMQRRLRRVNCTTAIPTPEEMTRLRGLNRQLQINIDCTLKETDLLQSRGNFDPKAMNNFYDHIEPGPVVPPKPSKKEHHKSSKQAPRPQTRDEDYEGAHWNCDSCTFLNHPALNRCEQCEMPRCT
ncbi:TGF-beta-activated kinase 1 and MAP3K7-binding protein 3 isoform X1 [Latimeria chalumnae]|uniref:TGF-beta activated kinase 1 (MAP3K7) binding protein 3 n=1 Tax=Latimeria chalumnae TaxID=7897 RepID=H3BAD2_LATCH|nr:PREDICTED: TGF-beta-activated kinase 1 and MAP3K7-binding protein 3 isoform X1 [Latimeria chalumnae]XP_005995021.1 PREDICTED: TGF-beta-activated kinase 1 and MAP3K7-binding protein 3 isoform X1 [Latimeria chalumnae]XP_005995022.1 PREDICTED: TGF-beta-activated kinase 1 and MAP3K7-binding protein 3 isoform X1 [Latimeria chalumnae]XP_005995023.1 PREDICTED: TGF-beta-activated kinase 1 and MAP3K7-binding protein 3 isoform X1 [Latimeria chalumnae]|eukprot:XP_005995020.1 PREDICTED: TGF-beta-activated kinase 1 and MAP3K7-binding protein 3 isoform X1 [Latimeria chalumnae]